jgi:hypothetical protein
MATLDALAHSGKFEAPQKGVPAYAFKTALNKRSERKSLGGFLPMRLSRC